MGVPESEWCGRIKNIKINFGSSGTKEIIVTSEFLDKEDFNSLLANILYLVKAYKSVEN